MLVWKNVIKSYFVNKSKSIVDHWLYSVLWWKLEKLWWYLYVWPYERNYLKLCSQKLLTGLNTNCAWLVIWLSFQKCSLWLSEVDNFQLNIVNLPTPPKMKNGSTYTSEKLLNCFYEWGNWMVVYQIQNLY